MIYLSCYHQRMRLRKSMKCWTERDLGVSIMGGRGGGIGGLDMNVDVERVNETINMKFVSYNVIFMS
jgi:hypothetical protein